MVSRGLGTLQVVLPMDIDPQTRFLIPVYIEGNSKITSDLQG